MYTFFEYCYYRIHSWYIVHKVDRTPRIYSTHLVSFGQTSNVITLICPLCYCLNIKVEFLFIFFPIHIIHCWLNYSFLLTEKKYQEWLSDQLDEKRDQIKKRENELEILTNNLERDRQKERYLRKKCDRARTHRLIQYGAAFESRRPEMKRLSIPKIYDTIGFLLDMPEVNDALDFLLEEGDP